MKPPSLKAIAPGITWGNYLNGAHLRGGARELGLWIYWSQAALAPNTLSRKYRDDPEERAKQLAALAGVIDNIPKEYGILPLKGLPDPGGVVPYMFDAFAYGIADQIWERLNIDGRYENVEAPTLHIGCWYDIFLGETLRQYETMKEIAAEKGSRSPRLLIGPWPHTTSFPSTVGDLDFGFASSGFFLNYK